MVGVRSWSQGGELTMWVHCKDLAFAALLHKHFRESLEVVILYDFTLREVQLALLRIERTILDSVIRIEIIFS